MDNSIITKIETQISENLKKVINSDDFQNWFKEIRV